MCKLVKVRSFDYIVVFSLACGALIQTLSMTKLDGYLNNLRRDLKRVSTAEKAAASRRYFPNGINCIGATAADIKSIIAGFHSENIKLTADEVLAILEALLESARYHEEKLIAFGLINKLVKNNYDDRLLERFEYWLEQYADNWAQVDDLCIKTIFHFLMARPHLIEQTQHWARSDVSWCRRASNVVWVKFVKRKIGKSTYCLNTELIFKNCDSLIEDKDAFVQKSVGWLLKVTSLQHEPAVIEYILTNRKKMTRPTLRYAIEKMDAQTRKEILGV